MQEAPCPQLMNPRTRDATLMSTEPVREGVGAVVAAGHVTALTRKPVPVSQDPVVPEAPTPIPQSR